MLANLLNKLQSNTTEEAFSTSPMYLDEFEGAYLGLKYEVEETVLEFLTLFLDKNKGISLEELLCGKLNLPVSFPLVDIRQTKENIVLVDNEYKQHHFSFAEEDADEIIYYTNEETVNYTVKYQRGKNGDVWRLTTINFCIDGISITINIYGWRIVVDMMDTTREISVSLFGSDKTLGFEIANQVLPILQKKNTSIAEMLYKIYIRLYGCYQDYEIMAKGQNHDSISVCGGKISSLSLDLVDSETRRIYDTYWRKKFLL